MLQNLQKLQKSDRPALAFAVLAGSVLPLAGCRESNIFQPPPPPEVTVVTPDRETITTFAEFTGKTEPAESVKIRARVTGVLEAIHFADSDEVEIGADLFTIEKGPYSAAVMGADAALDEAKANLGLAEVTVERVQRAFERNAASDIEVKKAEADRDAALAAVEVAKARLATAEIDLEYTDIKAPMQGRVSRHLVSIGNLVGPGGESLLTTIVDNSPMFAYFTISERAVIRYLDDRRAGRGRISTQEAYVTLSDGTEYEEAGTIDFADNVIDPRTGTIRARAIFANEDQFLLGGLFVRVRIPNPPVEAILVPELSLQRDMVGSFVFIVNEAGKVERRDVELGERLGKRRQILSGLEGTERVIVFGLQRCRPGIAVTVTEREAAPSAAAPAESTESDGASAPGTDD